MKLVKNLKEIKEKKSYQYFNKENGWIQFNVKAGFWENGNKKVLVNPETKQNMSLQEWLQQKIDNKEVKYLENEIISSR